MTGWREDPRLPYAIAALLGMIAGVAAKQAVAIQTGHYPRPVSILADFLVLGMIWLIVMYVHQWQPDIAIEGIALLSAALAMWGPKGISALLRRFQTTALDATEALAKSYIKPVEPIHRPTDESGIQREKEAMFEDENKSAKLSSVRKLRDEIPLKTDIPGNMARPLAEMDRGSQPQNPTTEEGGPNE